MLLAKGAMSSHAPQSPTAQVSRLAGVGGPMKRGLEGQEKEERGLLDKGDFPLEAALPVNSCRAG